MVPRKKILLVDDSNTVLLMHRMLLRNDYDLVQAANGEEAIAVAQRERPDIIFMDVVMPKMTGIEACRQLQGNPETKEIPVVMVTTRGEEQNVEAAYAAGCREYITKPFDATELFAKLHSILGDAGGSR
jgi:CheY-like chemotaxis protein